MSRFKDWLYQNEGVQTTPHGTGGGRSLDFSRRDIEGNPETTLAAQIAGPFCAACDGAETVVFGFSGEGDHREPCRRCGGSGTRN